MKSILSKCFKNIISNNRKLYTNKNFYNFNNKRLCVIGIDIGGTNTCMAILEPSGPRVIENAEGLRTTPSYITLIDNSKLTEFNQLKDEENIAIALNSKKQNILNKDTTIYGLRHFFVSDYSKIKQIIDNRKFNYNVLVNCTDKSKPVSAKDVYFIINNFKINSVEASSLILKYCKTQADNLLGKNIKKVVMSLPLNIINSLNYVQNDLDEMLNLVGLSAVKYIEEPKSIVLAYNAQNKNNILVVNLGGTEFSMYYMIRDTDVTKDKSLENSLIKGDFLETSDTINSVKSVNELIIKNYMINSFVGGDNIDNIVTSFLIEEFEKKNKLDPRLEPQAIQKIREAAEKAKIELSLSSQVDINLPFLMADSKGPKHLQLTLGRSKFERLLEDNFTNIIVQNCKSFKKEIEDANNLKDIIIDDILLSGGVTRIPLIQDIIKKIFINSSDCKVKELNKSVNPEEAAAIGASIVANSIELKNENKLDFNKLPLSIGVESLGGVFNRIINKDTILPYKKTFEVCTVDDNQPLVCVKFYLGERELCNDNRLIGEVKLKIPLNKKGLVKVIVSVHIDNSGILQIKIENLTKKSIQYSLDLSNDINDEIVQDVVSISNKFKNIDETKIKYIDMIKYISEVINLTYFELLQYKHEIKNSNLNENEKEKENYLKEINENLFFLNNSQKKIDKMVNIEYCDMDEKFKLIKHIAIDLLELQKFIYKYKNKNNN